MYKPIPPLKPSDLRRFWKYTKKQDGCWPWIGGRHPTGYGILLVNYTSFKASRLSYYIHNGHCDQRLMVCHKCDNPSCVNPDHLFLGTCKDNMQDCVAKGRIAHNPMPQGVRDGYALWVKRNPLARSGERNVNAKLSESDAYTIARMMRDGARCVDIARAIGASWASVNFVMKGKTWNHITGLPRHKKAQKDYA